MAITRIGVASAAGATVTEPAHAAGDILFLFATRDGNATPPTSPGGSGYSAWWDNTTNTYGGIFSIKVGTGTAVSVTATNATAIMIVAYRGLENPNTYTPAIDSSRETGSSTTCTNVALTLASTASGVLAFKASREAAATATATTVPTGMTLVGSVGTNEELALFEILSAGTTSWAPASQTISTGATGWITVAYEMVPTSSGDTITVDAGTISVTGQTVSTPADAAGSDTITVTHASIAVTGQTVWLHVVDNPYPDLPILSGTPPTGFTWPQDVVGLFETSDGKIAFGQRSNSAVTGGYLDLATHNADQSYNFTSDGKYCRMEVRSGDQYYEDSATSERSEMGTMREYVSTNTKYVFEFNSLFDGSSANTAGWCTLFQMHTDSGGSPMIGMYFEGSDFVVITRSGSSGSPTENYRYSTATQPAYGIYHRFTITADFTGGLSNVSFRVDMDGSTLVNVTGASIGYTGTTGFRYYWGCYRAEASETTSHQVKNIMVDVGDVVSIDGPGLLTIAGQSVTDSDSSLDVTTVDQGTITLTGQSVAEIEATTVDQGAITLTGQDVTVAADAGADTTPPTFVSGTINGAALSLTFDEAVQVTDGSGWITRANAGSNRTTSGTGGSGTTTLTGTINNPVIFGQAVTWQYVAASGDLRDMAGNELADLAATAITNLTPELVTVTETTISVTGQDVGVDLEIIPVDPATSLVSGQDVATPADTAGDTVAVEPAILSLAGGDVSIAEGTPPTPAVGGSGGAGGPSSDAAYHGTRRREQEKRDRERRLWKGEPARAVPDKAADKPSIAAEVKETLTPEPEPIDPLAEILTLLQQPSPVLLMEPRPSRYFDPEDDVSVLLLTGL